MFEGVVGILRVAELFRSRVVDSIIIQRRDNNSRIKPSSYVYTNASQNNVTNSLRDDVYVYA